MFGIGAGFPFSCTDKSFRPQEVGADSDRRVSHRQPVGKENVLKCESTVLWGFCVSFTYRRVDLDVRETCFADDSFAGACSLIL